MTIALSFLETSIANAYILYKIRNPFTAVKQLNFRENLVMDLLPNNVDNSQPIQRLIRNMHQIGKRDQKNCAICSIKGERKTTVYFCVECDENVCIVDCFYKLHTLSNVYSRRKSRNF